MLQPMVIRLILWSHSLARPVNPQSLLFKIGGGFTIHARHASDLRRGEKRNHQGNTRDHVYSQGPVAASCFCGSCQPQRHQQRYPSKEASTSCHFLRFNRLDDFTTVKPKCTQDYRREGE